MTKKASLKFLVLGLPIVAIAALVLVLTLGNGNSNKKVEAAGVGFVGHLQVGSCNATPQQKCSVAINTVYQVDIYIDKIPAPYDGTSIDLTSNTGACKDAHDNMASDWPHESTFSGCIGANQGESAASKGAAGTLIDPSSSKIGRIGDVEFNCGPFPTIGKTANGTIHMDATSFMVNSVSGGSDLPTIPDLLVNCVSPTSTPTFTPTFTPLPGIQMQKCFFAVNNHAASVLPTKTPAPKPSFGTGCIQDANLFLVDRNPPQSNTTIVGGVVNTCGQGEGVTLHEGLSNPAPNTAIKGQEGLGAFQFEVHYDSKAVCVGITPLTVNAAVACSTVGGTKGIIRFGCVTIGKQKLLGTNLAEITVRVTKEAVQQLRPGQENGLATQILDQNCQLSDLQGIEVPILSCEDANLSIRFLEGDVVPNCHVDVSDTQDIAFRWGAQKGSQLFQTFKDLSPSGHGLNGDGRIDIQDLQFVFGRFNSSCNGPFQQPAQPPFSDKTGDLPPAP